ncbi:unnamed protein product [Linum trigynum]|uniref:Uncharacterized protein n=1 Tax=Linum trigynum TaxID=586398 RepID=A0AAV2GHP7_9ROSI
MSKSKAFTLTSDQIFITPCVICSRTLDVYWYKGDLNDDFQGTRGAQTHRQHWDISRQVRVGPMEEQYKALQVFGTTVKRNKLRRLVKDLIKMRAGSAMGFNVFVNRIGLCIIIPVNGGGALRINDLFGWSRYGVKLPRDVGTGYTVWDRVDMYTRETVLDVRGMVRAGNELAARSKQIISSKLEKEEEVEKFTDRPDDQDRCDEKLLDQHSNRVTSIGMYTATKVGGTFSSAEEGNQELRQWLEEKSAELMACKKELEWSKKTESLLSKLVGKVSVTGRDDFQLEATQARREVVSLRARSEAALAIRQRTLIERETAARDAGAVLAEREAAVAAAEATLNKNFSGVREMLATAAEDAVRAREVAVSKREAAVRAREVAVSQREAAVAADEAAVRTMEVAVSQREAAVAADEAAVRAREVAVSAQAQPRYDD